jgi:hypothetical protein
MRLARQPDGVASLPQRRLVLLAHQFGTLERLHPRFVAWRRTWAHAVDAWTPSEGVAVGCRRC